MWLQVVVIIIDYSIIMAEDRPSHEIRLYRINVQPTYSRNTPFQNQESFPQPVFGIAHGHPFDETPKDTTSEFRHMPPAKSRKEFNSESFPSKTEESPYPKYHFPFYPRNLGLNIDGQKRDRPGKIPFQPHSDIAKFSHKKNKKCLLSSHGESGEEPTFREPLKRESEEILEQEFPKGPWEWDNNRGRPLPFSENVPNDHSFFPPWISRPPNESHESEYGDGSSSEVTHGKPTDDSREWYHHHSNEKKRPVGIHPNHREEFNGNHRDFTSSIPFQNSDTSTKMSRGPKKIVTLQNGKYTSGKNSDYEEGNIDLPGRRRQFGPYEAYFINNPLNQRSTGMEEQRNARTVYSCKFEGNHDGQEPSIHEPVTDPQNISGKQNVERYTNPPSMTTLASDTPAKIESDEQNNLSAEVHETAPTSRKLINKGGPLAEDDIIRESKNGMNRTTDCRGECSNGTPMNSSTLPSRSYIFRSTMPLVEHPKTLTTMSPLEFTENPLNEKLKTFRDIKKYQRLNPKTDNKPQSGLQINAATFSSTPPVTLFSPFPTPPQTLAASDKQLGKPLKTRNSTRELQ